MNSISAATDQRPTPFLTESKFLRGVELAALGDWLLGHWVVTCGALVAAVWMFMAFKK
jgi:hypothetical protein